MRLGDALVRIAEVQPHFFNSFYRRVRVIREAPRPMPAAATVNVTNRCSLRCPFCIAADVLVGSEMAVETFDEIAHHLKGVGRMTLIGGEPFQHTALVTICELARAAAPEVEVFTNGLVLGGDPARAGTRLVYRLPEASADWLTLVLSVDPSHAAQMPDGRLAAAVEGLLAAEQEGLCRARFSVTHAALRTGTYIDTDVIRTVLGEVSAPLADLFMDRLMEGRVQDTFYFNSVICSLPPDPSHVGDSTEGKVKEEFLRLEDLVFSPEVAVSFDSIGQPVVFSSLASMWSADPPPATRLGSLEEAGTRFMEWALAGGVVPSGIGTTGAQGPPSQWREAWDVAVKLADGEARSRLLRALPGCTEIFSWDGGARLSRSRAQAVLELVEKGTGGRVLRWGEDEGECRLDMPLFRELMHGLLADDEKRTALVESLGEWLSKLTGEAGRCNGLPVYNGDREILGKRVPLHPGETHPVTRVHLPDEPGFGPRDEFVVRPVLELHPDESMKIGFPGLVAKESPGPVPADEIATAVKRLAGMVEALCGKEIAQDVLARSQAAQLLSQDGAEESPVPLAMPAEDDLVTAFQECTFDRNRQRADEDNPELLALLLLHGRTRFSNRSYNDFASRALTWLERLARIGLSPTSRTLLGDVKLSGRNKPRLARLLRRE